MSRTKMNSGFSLKLTLAAIAGISLFSITEAQAQGLIWSLPDDGAWIRYEGDYEQVNSDPEAQDGEKTIKWVRHLIIKSVGKEMAQYKGKEVPCRWLELKVITGKELDGTLNPGLVGSRIYKILVPEARVVGDVKDSESIPVAYFPIIKGYRRVGKADAPPVEIKSKVFNIYPSICLLRHYKSFEAESGQPEDPGVGILNVSAVKYNGQLQLESRQGRSLHESSIWRSKDVPFGLAKWSVKIRTERKDNGDARADFQESARIQCTMTAQEAGTDATSELAVP
ncbi:MAG: hypothetical protein CMJ78_11785 [Planctomycetaceae bacterium]|nr:hypothetical protein [Planctomycetaceae bacterium]